MDLVHDSARQVQLLSELLFSPRQSGSCRDNESLPLARELAPALGEVELGAIERLASSNHVLVRGFLALRDVLETAGNAAGVEWINESIHREQLRIDHALSYLSAICETLAQRGCQVTVIKSLDHLPDLGSDLDLYSDADPAAIIETMKQAFDATQADLSWEFMWVALGKRVSRLLQSRNR